MAIDRFNSAAGSSRQASPHIGFDLLLMDQKRRRGRNHRFAILAPDNALAVPQEDRGNDLISRLEASRAGLGEFDGLTPAVMGISPQTAEFPERKPSVVVAPTPSVERIDPRPDRSNGLPLHRMDSGQQGVEPTRPGPDLSETFDTQGKQRFPVSTEMRTNESSKDGPLEAPGFLSQLMDGVQAATDTVTQTATFGTFDNFEGLFRALAKQAMGDKRDFSTIWSEELARVEKRVRGGKAATFGEGLGAGLSQGFSLNTVDMIDSGLFAALRQLAGDERDFREIYTEILDRKLKRWKAAKNAQPVATLTGEMVGSLALPGGPVVQGVRGGRVLNRIVSSPTGQAATAGFFGAEGDLSDKLTQGAVAAAATNVFNRTAGAVYARLGSPQQRSNQGPDGRFRERLLEESSPRSVVEAGQNVGVQVPATRLAFAPPVRALGRFAERAPGLGNIATVAGRMPSTDEAQRAARTRLNGARLLTPINAAAMAFDPFVQMSGAFAAGRIGLSVADVLARPVTAQQAANWSRAYARFIQGPSPRTQRALTSASSAFSSKLANEFGNSGGFESVTRALMGQSDTPERKE